MSGLFATRWQQAVSGPADARSTIRGLTRTAAISTLGLINMLPWRGPFLRPIYCHYVFDNQIEDFERLMNALKTIGTFVSTDDCVEMISGKRLIDSYYFHLSFDDGFRNVCRNALPILKKLAIPAVMFVPTSMISADYEVARRYCLDIANYPNVIEMATWDDLRAAQDEGFEIGSHTRTHARLADISNDGARLSEEVVGSKIDLEDRLGIECRYISWPFGTSRDVDRAALAAIRAAGYSACFSASRGRIDPERTDKFQLPRHHFEAQWPMRHVRFFALGGME